jgi:hypothetical protein
MADFKEDNRMTLDQEINHWWLSTRLRYVEKSLGSFALMKRQFGITSISLSSLKKLN